MNFTHDPPCIIGSSCRLPGGVQRTDALWQAFCSGDWKASSTSPPASRGFASYDLSNLPAPVTGVGGWLGPDGLELFDADFFGISPSEASTLRPNARLGLELTWEALENAGVPPSSLRGKKVTVCVAVGTEDGWDMKRLQDDSSNAFGCNWAMSSDPSGIAGRIAHIFDFRGTCNTVSNACAGGAFALRDAILSLYHEDAEIAIVGALSTHFSPAPFGWAAATGVASTSGRSSAFSPRADGYSPSEGAVFLVLRRHQAARSSGDVVHGIIRSFASGHNGATRTFMTPNATAQETLTRSAIEAASITPQSIDILEAHGTGTRIGDALELEAIRKVFAPYRQDPPLFISSSKTVFGHCHSAAALVGVLKMLACFKHRAIPAHHVEPHPDLLLGPIQVPVSLTPLPSTRTLLAQVNSFGFTGSISSIVIESGSVLPHILPTSSSKRRRYIFTFSGKTRGACEAHVSSVLSWARQDNPDMRDLASALAICRDHHPHRKSFVAASLEELESLCFNSPLNSGYCQPASDDERVTLDILNLETISPPQFPGLPELLKENRVLDAASLLYNAGHTVSFFKCIEKPEIDGVILSGLPLYPFNRHRHWKESATLFPFSPTHSMPPMHIPSNTISQEEFEDLISTFGSPIETSIDSRPVGDESHHHILLTGGNGMLGAQVLSRILFAEATTVYCVLRGQHWQRLLASFKTQGLDCALLEAARERGALHLMATTDISAPNLGLSHSDFAVLRDSINGIIHLAWNVNFNLPFAEFRPFLHLTRSLAELASMSRKHVTYYFISSYAATFNYPHPLVPELPLEPRVADSLGQGYAISKLIAEHSLHRILWSSPHAYKLAVVRVGQVCGNSTTGSWTLNEMMPMMIASLPALRALPRSMPDVTWIPSDVCADAIRDLVLRKPSRDEDLKVFHLANPTITPWTSVAEQLGSILDIGPPKLVSWPDYVGRILRGGNSLPISRLLPYFDKCLKDGSMPERYASLDVTETIHFSPSLKSCPLIGHELLRKLVTSIIGEKTLQHLSPSPGQVDVVFLFGPWTSNTGLPSDGPLAAYVSPIWTQIQGLISDLEDGDILSKDPNLERQLQTLTYHLATVKMLSDRSVAPIAVLGYCFGEYSAGIAAGILTLEIVVNILVRRAKSLVSITGGMLNVFCDPPRIRRILSCIPSPPSIAIYAGPKHVILSGSLDQIDAAQHVLREGGIKTLPVGTTIPFHSAEIDPAAINFPLLSYDTKTSHTLSYISGLTGTLLQGHMLGPKYWIRQMREPVRFYEAMEFTRKTYPAAVFVDVGPGKALTKIISYFGWPEATLLTPETAILAPDVHMFVPRTTNTHLSDPIGSADHGPIEPNLLKQIAVGLLADMFGFTASEPEDLLGRSLHALGLQSLDFIRFSEALGSRTGVVIPFSDFASDAPLQNIIQSSALTSE